MTEQNGMSMKRTKKKTWIKVYPEKWIFGSTREELTNAERAVWIDFLSLAALNDPPGQIEFISERRLANQLNISPKLLNSTIKNSVDYGKIEIDETRVGTDLKDQCQKSGSRHDQPVTKKANLVTTQPKFGLTVKTMKILKWNEYQSEYMRQKTYRSKGKKASKSVGPKAAKEEESQGDASENVTEVTDRLDKTREEKNRKEKTRGEEEYPLVNARGYPSPPDLRTSTRGSESNPPIDAEDKLLAELLSRLGSYHDYPFDDAQDRLMLLIAIKELPGINHMKELEKKIAWWKENPESLSSYRNPPREQLAVFFEKEYEFQMKHKNKTTP